MVLREQNLSVDDVQQADEMFLSSTLRDIVAVTTVDGREVGDGRPGNLTMQLSAQFEAFCEKRARERYRPALDAL